jgi:CubicO group peptidase (beta-lactamase class C family)
MEQTETRAQGQCATRFEPLRDMFEDLLASGVELGASLAVTIEGEFVVDLWGGWADEARTKAWDYDTITNVWSTTKTMTSLAALVLADRGELDLDAPVAHYWPEFAAAGKQDVLVRHVLSHTSGVAGWDEPMTIEAIMDHDRSVPLLAAQAPWWEPGTASGYHGLNYGHLVGEIVRRITGMRLGKFFAQEVAAPLSADFHIGLDPHEFGRVSKVVPPVAAFDLSAIPPGSPAHKMFMNPVLDPRESWTDAWRQADLGGLNGHGNARSVALLQSVVACEGEVGGVKLLSPRTVARIFEQQAFGVDLVLGIPNRFGIGYGLPNPAMLPYIPDRRCCYWCGWGGSLVIVDVDRRMTFAYVMNRMAAGLLPGPSAPLLANRLYRLLDATASRTAC